MITTIGNYVFFNCSGLKSITIPAGVSVIGEYAFSGCTGLTSITIPEGVNTIRNSAFYGCSGLTSITIPAGVTSIGNSAFYGCSRLTSITIKAITPPSLGNLGSPAIPSNVTAIYVPDASVADYQGNMRWKFHADKIKPISEKPAV